MRLRRCTEINSLLVYFALVISSLAGAESYTSDCHVLDKNFDLIGKASGDHCAFHENGQFASYDKFSTELRVLNKDGKKILTTKFPNIEGLDFSGTGNEILVRSYVVEKNEFCISKIPIFSILDATSRQKKINLNLKKEFKFLFPNTKYASGTQLLIQNPKNNEYECQFKDIDQIVEIRPQEFIVNAYSSLSLYRNNRFFKKYPKLDLALKFFKIHILRSGDMLILEKRKDQGVKIEVKIYRIQQDTFQDVYAESLQETDMNTVNLGSILEDSTGYIFSISNGPSNWVQKKIDFSGKILWNRNLKFGQLKFFKTDIQRGSMRIFKEI